MAAAAVAALSACWWLRHVTAQAVRSWRPGTGVRRRLGPLAARTFGCGEAGVVLLHGLVSSGDQFGAGFDELGEDARVLCPDLLGFGGSFDEQRRDFSLDAHLRSLHEAIESAGLGEAPLTIAGHSLGGTLAVHLAASRIGQVRRVVLWNAPLHPTVAATREHIRRLGLFERLFALEGPLAAAACHWMCHHRTASAWLATTTNPTAPTALSRGAVRHTWTSYLGAMNEVLLNPEWQTALATLSHAGVPVLLVSAARDNVVNADYYRELAATHPGVTTIEHPSADHLLPISHPQWCAEQISHR
ncbi:MAG: alpha/beta fold hydrolase [Solirubrobacterales bacterium]